MKLLKPVRVVVAQDNNMWGVKPWTQRRVARGMRGTVIFYLNWITVTTSNDELFPDQPKQH